MGWIKIFEFQLVFKKIIGFAGRIIILMDFNQVGIGVNKYVIDIDEKFFEICNQSYK